MLADWAPELADTFVALACDIALVVDASGCIAKLAQHQSHPIAPESWVGMPWVQTASPDSQPKIEQMLVDVAATGHSRRREINHPDALGGAVPVAYSAARLGSAGPMLAVGHDLRAHAALQQRFVAAQEALERSYWNAQPAPGGRAPAAPALMTQDEKDSLGLLAPSSLLDDTELADHELARAMARLVDRIGHDELPGLLRDARRLAERHFLARALQRAGGKEALKGALRAPGRAVPRRKKN